MVSERRLKEIARLLREQGPEPTIMTAEELAEVVRRTCPAMPADQVDVVTTGTYGKSYLQEPPLQCVPKGKGAFPTPAQLPNPFRKLVTEGIVLALAAALIALGFFAPGAWPWVLWVAGAGVAFMGLWGLYDVYKMRERCGRYPCGGRLWGRYHHK